MNERRYAVVAELPNRTYRWPERTWHQAFRLATLMVNTSGSGTISIHIDTESAWCPVCAEEMRWATTRTNAELLPILALHRRSQRHVAAKVVNGLMRLWLRAGPSSRDQTRCTVCGQRAVKIGEHTSACNTPSHLSIVN